MAVYYVPAGIEQYSTDFELGVRFKENKEEKSYFGRLYKRWDLKDRTLELYGSSVKENILPTQKPDVVLQVRGSDAMATLGFEKILINPIHGEKFRALPYIKRGMDVIVDSGGFQLLSGVTDFVHPDDVIARYNEGATIGMPLDLPVVPKMEPYYFDIASKLMKANDEYILPRLKGVNLALISHGTSLDLRKRRLDVLDREADYVAIAGLNMSVKGEVQYTLLENLMYVTHRYRDRGIKYFHVLGVTSKLWFLIYAYLSEIGHVSNIGGDSVSYRLSALVGDHIDHLNNSTNIDREASYGYQMLCNCPVCTLVPDSRVMHEHKLLEMHNLIMSKRMVDHIQTLVREFIAGSVTYENMLSELGLSRMAKKLKNMIRYTDTVESTGVFKPFNKKVNTHSLFGKVGRAKPLPTTTTLSEEDKKLHARLANVVKQYEKFHGKRFS